MDLLFVGFNPSIRSSETGHHFANPNNRFWTILEQSGITPRKYAPTEDYTLVELGFGLTNIVQRPTKTAQEITKEEYKAGREELITKIKHIRPKVVCFVGKGVYQQYSGKREVPWGVQQVTVVPDAKEFVATSSSGLVRMRMDEIIEIYRDIPLLIESINRNKLM